MMGTPVNPVFFVLPEEVVVEGVCCGGGDGVVRLDVRHCYGLLYIKQNIENYPMSYASSLGISFGACICLHE